MPSRREFVKIIVGGAGSLWLAACGQTEPASPTSKPAAATVAPTAAPAKPTQAAATAAPSPAAAKPTAPAEDWNQVVEAAKREGTVAVWVPSAAQTRAPLTAGFEARNPGIKVQFENVAAPQIATKIMTERGAGNYNYDLIVHGTSIYLPGLKQAGALTPIAPFLTGPSTRDLTKWWRGKFIYADDAEKYALTFSAYVQPPFTYNTKMVNPDDFKSYKDLLDPKWKGKIASQDPRLAGNARYLVSYWYQMPELGKDFIRELFQKQEVVLSRDDRQLLDWAARGQYPIEIGAGTAQTIDFIQQGLPIQVLDASKLRETPGLNAGIGNVVVLDRAPHPNATKVYLDYLLSKDVQAELSKATMAASYRLDVPRDQLGDFLVPKDGVSYKELHTEAAMKFDEQVDALLKEILPA